MEMPGILRPGQHWEQKMLTYRGKPIETWKIVLTAALPVAITVILLLLDL